MATILVVDDRQSNRSALTALLDRAGHRVVQAGDGAEALESVRSEHPDLVVSDVVMPGVDGYQFVLRMRRDRSLPQPRVIFISGTYTGDEDRSLAERCAISRFIAKPADPPVLLETIAQVLAEPAPHVDLHNDDERDLAQRYQTLTASKLAEQVLKLEELTATLDSRVTDRTLELEREIDRRRQDEEALHRNNARLSELAALDPLTGLFNRRYLEDVLSRQASARIAEGSPVGAMMIDVDHFKRINDRLGHATGDAVLIAIARCMQGFVRDCDLLCRYGGEEFALLFGGATPAALRERAEAMREAVQALRVDCGSGIECRVTISIGVAIFPDHGPGWSDTLRAADAALYRAKRSGRNRVKEAVAAPFARTHAGRSVQPSGKGTGRHDSGR